MDTWKSTARKKLKHEKRQEGEDTRRRRSEQEKVRREKMQVCEKVGKSRNTVFLQCFVAPKGRRVGSLKRRVRSQLARWEMKNCTPLWHEAHFEVKSVKARRSRTSFGSWDVEKVHAVVGFGSQNVQSTPSLEHFWKLRCGKSARRCGAKHILRKNVKITTCSGHFLMSRLSFDVEKVHAVAARSTFPSQKCAKLRVLSDFWCVRCPLVDR